MGATTTEETHGYVDRCDRCGRQETVVYSAAVEMDCIGPDGWYTVVRDWDGFVAAIGRR